jgi:glycine dehydrogenase
MLEIRNEVAEIIDGKQPKDNNVLKNAPHSLHAVLTDDMSWGRYGEHAYAMLMVDDFG